MSNSKYISFLEKIIKETKERKLIWKYLDSNTELYQGMDWVKTVSKFSSSYFRPEETEVINFDDENSFFVKKDKTYIVLLSRNNNPATLYVVPYTYKKVLKFPPSEYGEYITRLMNLVQSEFPTANDFIDSYLQDK